MAWKDIDDNILTKKALYEDLLEEREDIIDMIDALPEFLPTPNWHLTEQHILRQCLIDVEDDLQRLGLERSS